MATLVLQAAGSAIGSAMGGPMMAAVGQAAGGLLGSMLDQRLLGGGKRYVEGPRLKQLDGITASEGAPIPRIYGRVRLGGQIIWATRFEEQSETTRQGKSGGKSSSPKPATIATTYSYFANLAVAVCEGPIAMVRRIWADGKPLDLTTVTLRIYRGDNSQQPDPLIVARQGESPAYRGTAYVVFERLPLTPYGNRLPQLSFEVVRAVDGLAQMIRGVDLIPGASEFGYHPGLVSRSMGQGASAADNRNQLTHASDIEASLDALQALMPNAGSVALVSTWFGSDLRAGECEIAPAVDIADKVTIGGEWGVAGLTRSTARVVSQSGGRAAYGGTPSDHAIRAAIGEMKSRGLSVVFYPFVMMDVPADNALPDPWTGAASQPAYPWRGRITCMPAPGRPASPDATAAAADQVAAFFGTVSAGDYAVAGSEISYSGPDEWSYSRLVLHSAALCKAAGGVDAFIIGSELVGLTRVRSAAGVYPAVTKLVALAAQVRALLGPAVKIGYAADWTEYGAHVLDGGAEVRFPLDPLWADANIDFVGIDYYPPVADWRDGSDHLDAGDWPSGRDLDYLKAGFGAGEAYDWYYADAQARDAQQRTPISDGAYSKPWIYRAKDIANWWSHAHVERVGGVETTTTAWAAASKPVWLTEIGCPAVDKGANAPNLFPDARSSEGGYPPFSHRTRDDLLQARFLEAAIARFDPAHPAFEAADNPVSPVYGGRMVDPARIHVWAWDARPYPAFPHLSDVWGDGPNWLTGHWITGRIEGMALDRLIAQICADYGLEPPELLACDDFLDGYVIDRPMSARAALEPLLAVFGVDAGVSAGTVRFSGRATPDVLELGRDDLVPDRRAVEIACVRAQETELPRQISLGFADAESQYQRAAVSARRTGTVSRREQASETSAVLRRADAQRLADIALQDSWISRETAEFALRPGLLALEAGDIVWLPVGAEQRRYQITRITDGVTRRCQARAIEPDVFTSRVAPLPVASWTAPPVAGPPLALVMHLPADPGEPTPLALLAVRATPWAGPYTLWRSPDGASYEPVGSVARSAILGTTTSTLGAGPLWRWDRGNSLTLRLHGGALSATDDMGALAGRNLIGLLGQDGVWEILSFRDAELIGPGEWRISRLVRGGAGTEAGAARVLPAGSQVVMLDTALIPLFASPNDLGSHGHFRLSPVNRDHADPVAISFEATAGSAALKPLSPVHPRARRTAQGIELSWVRRTRRDGDSWELAEVPLAEEAERYQVDILAGSTVKRSVQPAMQSMLYAGADEIADFGTEQAVLSVRISQISRVAGAGTALSASVPVCPRA